MFTEEDLFNLHDSVNIRITHLKADLGAFSTSEGREVIHAGIARLTLLADKIAKLREEG